MFPAPARDLHRGGGVASVRSGYPWPVNLHGVLRAAERATALDRPGATVAGVARRVLGTGRLDRALRGAWLGHPVHPLLVTVPIGAWACSAVADATGQRDTARTLVTIGLTATPPTVVAGLADYSRLDARQRRVGMLHALGNAGAAGCFLVSRLLRDRPSPVAASVWSAVGLVMVGAGGALGGHLSYAQGAGVGRWQPLVTGSATAGTSRG